MRETFGDVLRVLMARQGMTCAALEEAAGLGEKYVYRVRSGRRHPGPNVIDAMARALELDDWETEQFFQSAGYVSERGAAHARAYLLVRNG